MLIDISREHGIRGSSVCGAEGEGAGLGLLKGGGTAMVALVV